MKVEGVVEGVAAVLRVLLTIAIAAGAADTRTTVFHVDGMT